MDEQDRFDHPVAKAVQFCPPPPTKGDFMPYRSDAQRKKFHALVKEGKIPQKVVDEYDDASKGLNLPERIRPKKSKVKITSIKQLRQISEKK